MISLSDDISCGSAFCRTGIGILSDLEVMFLTTACNKSNNCTLIRQWTHPVYRDLLHKILFS